MQSIIKFAFLNKKEGIAIMKRFDLLKCFLFLLFSFMSLSVLGMDDPSDLYFVSQNRAGFSRFAMNDKMTEHFRKVYQAEEIFMLGPKSDNYDFSVLKGKKLKCFAAFVGKKSNFEIDLLKGMPLEVLNLSFSTPRKLSELQTLLTPSLKELYLSGVILDEPSLLSPLKLETLVLNGLTYNDDIMMIIAQMKSLKRLELTFHYEDKFNEFWIKRNDIPFAILNDLTLTALRLDFPTPAVLYFLEKQKQLKILTVAVAPPFKISNLISSIAGREFDLLAIKRFINPDLGELKDLLNKYQVKVKVLLVNGKRVIPGNDNEEIKSEQKSTKI